MKYSKFLVSMFVIGAQSGSWDSYIDNLIAQSKDASGTANVDKACIIGLDGGASWTTNGHSHALKLSLEEAVFIAQAFKAKDFSKFMTKGIRAEGTKYLFLREEDENTVLTKIEEHGSLSLKATNTVVVIGHCPNGRRVGRVNHAVSVIAEYFQSIGM